MSISVARLISLIFNPIVVLAVLPYVVVLKATGNAVQAYYWTGYTLLFLLIMAIFVLYGVKRKMFTDIDISKREQRPIVFFISILIGLVYLCGLYFFHAPHMLFVITFGILGGITVAGVINTFIKASIHTATISALLFSVAVVYGGYFILLLLLIPLVAWARIKEKRHTLSEAVVGGMLGILLSLIVYIVIEMFFS